MNVFYRAMGGGKWFGGMEHLSAFLCRRDASIHRKPLLFWAVKSPSNALSSGLTTGLRDRAEKRGQRLLFLCAPHAVLYWCVSRHFGMPNANPVISRVLGGADVAESKRRLPVRTHADRLHLHTASEDLCQKCGGALDTPSGPACSRCRSTAVLRIVLAHCKS